MTGPCPLRESTRHKECLRSLQCHLAVHLWEAEIITQREAYVANWCICRCGYLISSQFGLLLNLLNVTFLVNGQDELVEAAELRKNVALIIDKVVGLVIT